VGELDILPGNSPGFPGTGLFAISECGGAKQGGEMNKECEFRESNEICPLENKTYFN